jgi:hypothetical protein
MADQETTNEQTAAAPRRGLLRGYWWVWTALTLVLAAVVALAVLAGVLVVAAVRSGERVDQVYRTARRECADLETRLNRLAPPGAAKGPAQRAAAIRAENAAADPLLTALESAAHYRSGYITAWHELIGARTGYAEALNREASGGERAFFVPPRFPGGRSTVDVLLHSGPDACAAPVRRLAHPDL